MRFFSSLFLCTMLMTAGVQAQKLSDFAKVDTGYISDGFFFYLPRTAIEFEFTVTETRYTKGELSAFANQYFQSQPEITKNRSEYSIEHISMKPYSIPDPSQRYRYTAETASQVSIQTVTGGIIKSINAYIDVKPHSSNSSNAVSTFKNNNETPDKDVPFFSLGIKNDTIINREITPDSTVIERRVINRRTVTNTPEEMARESIQKLDDIRKVRYTLISGPEDVMLEGNSLEISLKELAKTEQELLSLFFGRTKKISKTYRVTYIPGESPETLFYLSPESGVSMSANSTFPNVKINVRPFTGLDNRDIYSGISLAKGGIIPYRTPEKMVISIQWNGNKYFEAEMMIPQYGQVHAVPVKKLSTIRVIYDEQSGAIESIGPIVNK